MTATGTGTATDYGLFASSGIYTPSVRPPTTCRNKYNMSPPSTPSPRHDASRFPLIRDILATYTPPRRDDSSSWLSSPGVVAAVQRTMPPGYGSSGDKTAVDGAGQLLVWGAPRAAWECCLRVRGLRWATLRADLADLMAGHDVYVSCVGWCVVVLADNGAVWSSRLWSAMKTALLRWCIWPV